MNYKVMQRPMFKLGGGVVKGKKVGNRENFATITEIENLINERSKLRSTAADKRASMLPFQVLAGQGDNIRTIRSLGDVTNILSNLGTDPNTFAALGKLDAIDLKKSDDELTDKITLAKLRSSQNKKYEFERRLARANQLKGELSNYVTEQQGLGKTDEEIRSSGRFQSLNRDIDYLLRETSLKDFLYQARLKDGEDFDIKQATKEYYDIGKVQQEFKADGGRIGYQEGTPNPNMVMPQPKPEEAMNDRRVDTLMEAAPAMEDPNEARSMGDQDMYKSLRKRLPPEITDDVVRLIAYNREAFTDFANISDQSDVQSFNQKYNVELVLPVGNQ
jgi:hypothetical protein